MSYVEVLLASAPLEQVYRRQAYSPKTASTGGSRMSVSYMAKPEEVVRKWYVVDASGKTLGRLASRIASILRGKHKATFTPHVDTGDYVIVVNAGKVLLTGNKLKSKIYYRHTGYPGGLKSVTCEEMLNKHPERVMHQAVWGMLPHNRLGRSMIKKLKVYDTPDHPHQAQKPEDLDVE